jgi:hypothetical protein
MRSDERVKLKIFIRALFRSEAFASSGSLNGRTVYGVDG